MNKQIDIMTNFAQDNNVLTKEDEFDGFKPMLKRFMVWDRHNKSFRINNDNDTQVFDIAALISFYMYEAECGIPHTDFDLVQSTNLFDKDGREIFEGSVVEFRGNKHLVVFKNGCFIIDNSKLGFFDTGWSFNQIDLWNNDSLLVRIVGYILSNPELLEGG